MHKNNCNMYQTVIKNNIKFLTQKDRKMDIVKKNTG